MTFPNWLPRMVVISSIVLFIIMFLSQLSYEYLLMSNGKYLEDLWVANDAIWRVYSGHYPNVDFVSPIGPLFYGVYFLMLKMEPPSLLVIVHANLFVGVVCAVLTIAVAARSMRGEALALLSLFTFLTAASGRDFGTTFSEQMVSYLAPYNRWAWALAIPAMIGLLLPARAGARISYLVTGACGAALFFLKMTYFAAFLGVLIAAFALDAASPESRKAAVPKALTIAGGMLALVLIGALLFGATSAYLADIGMVARANSSLRLYRFIEFSLEAVGFLGLGAVIYFMLGGFRSWADWPDLARIAIMVGAGTAILVQNHDSSDAPLYYAALILAYSLGSRMASAKESPQSVGRGPILSFALLALALLTPVGADIGESTLLRIRSMRSEHWSPVAAFAGTPLEPFRSSDIFAPDGSFDREDQNSSACNSELCRVLFMTADGKELLTRIGHSKGSVLPLAFSNPFSSLMRTRPPKGSLIWWHYGRSFNEENVPPASAVFQDVETVLVPKDDGNGEALARIYASTLARDFKPVGESEYWIALRRKNQTTRLPALRSGA